MSEIARTYPPDREENHPDWDARYSSNIDNGTMPECVKSLATAVVGRRIVKAERESINPDDFSLVDDERYWSSSNTSALVLTLDDGRRVAMVEGGDCCAYTNIQQFLLNVDRIDHAITAVVTEQGWTRWHILADLGDVLTMDVEWSCGNPFYYTYGFSIAVSNTIEGSIVEDALPRPGQRELA